MDQLSFLLYNTNEVVVDENLIQKLSQKQSQPQPSSFIPSSLNHTPSQPSLTSNPSAANRSDILSLLNDRVSKLQQKQSQRKVFYQKTIHSLQDQLKKTNTSFNTQDKQISCLINQLTQAKKLLGNLVNLVQSSQNHTTIIKSPRQMSWFTNSMSNL